MKEFRFAESDCIITSGQNEDNGIYWYQIKYPDGDISGGTCDTPFEMHKSIGEHFKQVRMK